MFASLLPRAGLHVGVVASALQRNTKSIQYFTPSPLVACLPMDVRKCFSHSGLQLRPRRVRMEMHLLPCNLQPLTHETLSMGCCRCWLSVCMRAWLIRHGRHRHPHCAQVCAPRTGLQLSHATSLLTQTQLLPSIPHGVFSSGPTGRVHCLRQRGRGGDRVGRLLQYHCQPTFRGNSPRCDSASCTGSCGTPIEYTVGPCGGSLGRSEKATRHCPRSDLGGARNCQSIKQ